MLQTHAEKTKLFSLNNVNKLASMHAIIVNYNPIKPSHLRPGVLKLV